MARRVGLTLILLTAGVPILVLVIGFAGLIIGLSEPRIPPVNLLVEVINQTSSTGTLEWESASGSGRKSIGPCGSADTVAEFAHGPWQVTISEGSATLTAKGSAPLGLTYEYFGIVAEGQIRHLYTLTIGQAVPPRPSGC